MTLVTTLGDRGSVRSLTMEQAVLRTRLFLIAGAYAAVVAISAALITARYVAYMTHPADVDAYGGMWAGGDLALEVMIGGMLLFVTFFLVLVIANAEATYTTYSKILVGISVTLPMSIGLIAIPAIGQGNSLIGWVCLYRVFGSPLVLIGLGMSRIFARFPKPKRMTTYALLIEGLTLVFMVVMLVSPFKFQRG